MNKIYYIALMSMRNCIAKRQFKNLWSMVMKERVNKLDIELTMKE